MNEQPTRRFGPFRLDTRNRQLLRGDEALHIEPRSFDALCCLVDHAGELVTKRQLVDEVWQRGAVTDNALTRCVHHVRAVLGDSAESPTYIETVPGSGYRFIAAVERVPANRAPPASVASRAVRPALALVAAASLLALWVWPQPPPSIERIAVLPLANLTGDEQQEYFVQGVHDALIAELSRVAGIDVISRTSVMALRSSQLMGDEMAAALDVDAFVEGSVLRTGDTMTVTAQLIATNPERHLWADRYHRDVGALFEIATEIVNAIAAEIAIELAPQPAVRSGPDYARSSEAYEAFLRGRFDFEQRTPDGYARAQQQYRRAIAIDPTIAPAYASLAHTFGSAAIFGQREPADAFPEARRLAQRAVEIDPQLVEAHLILAGVRFYWDWDWAAAERHASYALTLNPSSAHAYRLLAEIYSVTGRHTEALAAIERGREFDPLPPTAQLKPSLILYLSRDFERAVERARDALVHHPAFWQGHWLVCLSESALDRHDAATAACKEAARLSRQTPMAVATLGLVEALAGNASAAESTLAALLAMREQRYVGAAGIALIYGALGRTEEAFIWLDSAYDERDPQLVHAENAAYFDALRGDGRFLALRRAAVSNR